MDNNEKFSQTVDIVGDKHTLGIIKILLSSDERFCEIQRGIKLNPITLTNRLRKLEDAGLVYRSSGTFNKLSVAYALTAKGKKLKSVIQSIEAISKQL